MRLVVSRLAARRLAEIADYHREYRPSLAPRLERALRAAFEQLLSHPLSGRRHHLNVRRLVLPRLSYAIYYRVDEEAAELTIITVRHAAQRPL